MSRFALLLSLALLATSCQPRSSSAQARFYQDGRQKPTVALVPVFDHTSPTVEWDLSEEMTHAITDRLLRKDKLFLTHEKKVRSFIKDLQHSQNPFTMDIAWIKPIFAEQDFVVFMELLEHTETPIKNSPQDNLEFCAAELSVSLRVRVLDLRGENPKIVLQEIIHQQQHLPRQFTKFNFYQVGWGQDGFAISPLGLAHAQLTKEVASRIEEYIVLARGSS
jgi:hypothetical protein